MKNLKRLAVFDVDDTFYHLKETIQNALKLVTGKDIHHSTWNSFMLNEVYKVELETVFEAFHKGDILNTGMVDHSIKDILKHFKEEGFDTLALTSRGWHTDAVKITNNMLDENGIVFDHVQVVPHNHSKGSVLKEQWEKDYKIDFFIDDYHKNIHGVYENVSGSPLIVVRNQPWNSKEIFDNNIFKRIDNLNEIYKLYEDHFKVKNKEELNSSENKIIRKNKIKPH